MTWDTKPIKRSQGDPVPQGFDPTLDEYQVAHITKNALWQALVDPNTGQFIGITDGKINIRASEIEIILASLATAANQAIIISHVDGVETALTTLNEYVDQLETILTAMKETAGIKKITDAVDVADRSERALGNVTVNNSALPTGAATSAKQDSIISNIDELETILKAIRDTSGIKKITDAVDISDRAARALGKIAADDAALTQLGAMAAAAVTDPTAAATVIALLKGILKQLQTGPNVMQLSGSSLEIYKATVDERPEANTVPVGCVFMAVQTQEMWQSDGTNWVVI
ncbi:hypothetical protein Dred_2596 [Desulforamulus reducens MI-1]|uniref:Uncharacterized protein n=1 Tax=Desulforamulus reducens (strain ATCC BAA-1160 / DSM 100696 / MI-1) TaxID=349161 RepID=A4J7Q3_DESRM|nr:hypothetical protein [Desulforamulus reducens]ABO51106.1 hypothetical protein Dred_2596 [Desulforamulus reducens MI-1]